jgi:hypothetical protein
MNLISASEIKQLTVLPLRTENYLFENDIDMVQQQTIKPVLGSSLYAWLENQIANNSTNALALNLKNKVAPALSWHTLYRALPFMQLQLTASGLESKAKPGANNDGTADLLLLQHQCRQRANFHSKQLYNWLKTNRNQYPAWKAEIPEPEGFDFGLYLPD